MWVNSYTGGYLQQTLFNSSHLDKMAAILADDIFK